MLHNPKYKMLLLALAVLIALTPLGLISDASAWGEWDIEEITKMAGFTPQGMKEFSPLFAALIPDYELVGVNKIIAYLLSAVIGVLCVFGFFRLLTFKKCGCAK